MAIQLPEIVQSVDNTTSPISALAALVGFKGALMEIDEPHPAVLELIERATEIAVEFLDALDYAGITD